jgi:hypothetical protein
VECYCGCGRKVSFSRRGANKKIRRTSDLIGKLQDGRHAFDLLVDASDPNALAAAEVDPAELLQRLDEGINAGDYHRDMWVGVTHGEHVAMDPDVDRWEKQDWTNWTRSALALWVMIERRRRRDGW